MPTRRHTYDIVLSFAGEDRYYAETLANMLLNQGLKVFYDKYEEASLWGKNLYDYLTDIYQNKAHYCIMLLSRYYAAKLWTNLEQQAAQARAFQENQEYILPIRLDDTAIPGILPTIAYLRWPPETPENIVKAVLSKIASS